MPSTPPAAPCSCCKTPTATFTVRCAVCLSMGFVPWQLGALWGLNLTVVMGVALRAHPACL